MTTQAGLGKKERDFLASRVGDAYTMLDPRRSQRTGPGVACRPVSDPPPRGLPARTRDDAVITAETVNASFDSTETAYRSSRCTRGCPLNVRAARR